MRLFACAGACFLAIPVSAQNASIVPEQRTNENAIRQAQDGFGVSIGDETVGLYTSTEVRGFSPIRANNVRIDGLYFDQVWAVNQRIRSASTIRVGVAALGSVFSAPTGIVDNNLRRPGAEATLSAVATFDSFGAAALDLDGVVPIAEDHLSVHAGASLSSRPPGANAGADGGVAHLEPARLHEWRLPAKAQRVA